MLFSSSQTCWPIWAIGATGTRWICGRPWYTRRSIIARKLKGMGGSSTHESTVRENRGIQNKENNQTGLVSNSKISEGTRHISRNEGASSGTGGALRLFGLSLRPNPLPG